MIEALSTEGAKPPAELIEAEACRMFSKTPSELAEEDYGKIIKYMTILGIADKTRATNG